MVTLANNRLGRGWDGEGLGVLYEGKQWDVSPHGFSGWYAVVCIWDGGELV
jgi:hypothetical protein